MQKQFFGALILSLLLVISIVPASVAQEMDDSEMALDELEEELENVDAGTTPDGAFYGIDVALDSLRYRLARDKETAGLKIAQERLEELKQMSREGRLEEAEEAKERHDEILARVKARVEAKLDNTDEDALTDAVKVETALTLQEAELEELKDRLAELTPEQRRTILAFLANHGENLGRIKGELQDKESDSLVRFEERLGKSEVEIRDELNRLREEKRLKAEVFDDVSIVTVDYRFKQRSEDGTKITTEALFERLLSHVKTDYEEASSKTRIVSGSDDNEKIVDELEEESNVALTGQVTDDNSNDASEDDKEDDHLQTERLRVRVDLKEKDGRTEAEIQFRLRFISGTDEETIYQDIVTQTNALTIEELHAIARIHEQARHDNERNVEIKVRDRDGVRVAEVRIAWDGLKDRFIVESADKAEIIAETAARIGATEEEVLHALKRFEQKEAKQSRPARGDDKDDDSEDDESDDSDSTDDDSSESDSSSDDDDSDDDESDDDSSGSGSGSGDDESDSSGSGSSGSGS